MSPPPPLPTVPGYEVLGLLGRGGMGVVYKARHSSSGRVVALKFVLGDTPRDLVDLLRFRVEAEAIACLNHPHVVKIRDVGVFRGRPYFALDYAARGSLADWAATARPGPRRAAEVVRQVAGAVHFAHTRGIMHRDLKPSNVLMGGDETPLVTDFGLAKFLRPVDEVRADYQTMRVDGMDPALAPYADVLSAAIRTIQTQSGRGISQSEFLQTLAEATVARFWDREGGGSSTDDPVGAVRSFLAEAGRPAGGGPDLDRALGDLTSAGAVMGSPGYLAPEQARGLTDRVGPACDVYGLGAVLYFLLSGRPPFRGGTQDELLARVRTDPPDPLDPGADPALAAVCRKCLSKPPEARYATAADLGDDLGRFLDGLGTAAAREQPAPVTAGAVPADVATVRTPPRKDAGGRTWTWWPFRKRS